MQDLPLLSTEPRSCLRQKQNCRGYNICSSTPTPRNKTCMADVLLFINMQTCTNLIISNDSWVLCLLINHIWRVFQIKLKLFFLSGVKWDVKILTLNSKNCSFQIYWTYTSFSKQNLVIVTKQTLPGLVRWVWTFHPKRGVYWFLHMGKQDFWKNYLKENIRNLLWHRRQDYIT